MARYEELKSVNTSEGLQNLIIHANVITEGLFVRMLLFSVFMIIWLGGYFASLRISGRANLSSGFAVAGYVTLLVTMALSIVNGMVDITSMVIVASVCFIGTLWFLFDNKD